MERRFSASSQTPTFFRRPSLSSSASSLSPFSPPHPNQHRQRSPDRITPPTPSLLAALSTTASSSSIPELASMHPPGPVLGPGLGSGLGPPHPWLLQGPQPISPPPAPPQISAAELLSLTETSATQTGTYQCSICAKQFGYKNGLIRHVRLTHVGEKPYQCSICNRRFGYKHILLEHQNLHFGNRPYVCAVCDKRFAARSNLIQHQMVHKRPFNCTLCSRRFDREEQLKKHLFVHPDVCRGFGQVVEASSSSSSSRQSPAATRRNTSYNPAVCCSMDGTEDYSQHCHPPMHAEAAAMTAAPLPDSSQEHLPGTSCSSSSEEPMARLQSMADAGHHGNRIDAICNQLTLQGMAAAAGVAPGGVVTIKQELVDSTEDERGVEERRDGGVQPQQPLFYRKPSAYDSAPVPVDLHRSSRMSSSSFSACSSSSASSSSSHNCKDPFLGRPNPPPPNPNRSLPGETPSGVQAGYSARSVSGTANGEQGCGSAWDKQVLSSSALPGIHEVFSRRTKAHHELPSFANFMPLSMVGGHLAALPDPALKARHQLHQATASTSSHQAHPSNSTSVAQQVNNPGGSGGHRPTAQLPPITHPPARQTKDQAIQHSLSITAGFPSLDDVLSYYVSQGRLFKCQHCNILFFERGMYFLHASLHGLTSPWQCSICHKVCADKNEFTLHFVNQQHTP